MFTRVVALVLLALCAGCSVLFLDRPPRAVRQGDVMPTCTTSQTYPILDAALAATGIVGGIGIATGIVKETQADGTKRDLSGSERAFFASAAIVESIAFIYSSLYGFETARQCRKLQGAP